MQLLLFLVIIEIVAGVSVYDVSLESRKSEDKNFLPPACSDYGFADYRDVHPDICPIIILDKNSRKGEYLCRALYDTGENTFGWYFIPGKAKWNNQTGWSCEFSLNYNKIVYDSSTDKVFEILTTYGGLRYSIEPLDGSKYFPHNALPSGLQISNRAVTSFHSARLIEKVWLIGRVLTFDTTIGYYPNKGAFQNQNFVVVCI